MSIEDGDGQQMRQSTEDKLELNSRINDIASDLGRKISLGRSNQVRGRRLGIWCKLLSYSYNHHNNRRVEAYIMRVTS